VNLPTRLSAAINRLTQSNVIDKQDILQLLIDCQRELEDKYPRSQYPDEDLELELEKQHHVWMQLNEDEMT